jgi:hypothetical protein
MMTRRILVSFCSVISGVVFWRYHVFDRPVGESDIYKFGPFGILIITYLLR